MEAHWGIGDCWLGCGRTGLPVVWLGPSQWDGQHTPVYACEDDLNRLKAQALAYFMQRQPAVA
ncbi:hypothetical protein [Streptomyces blattellae]|uniref:hypothetical protein n=1 Tax=Streptomyces blattellae TaxID=2569855 RepID=UPI0012B78E97|nr:hypothetical protein [Streptomyces blattellae]